MKLKKRGVRQKKVICLIFILLWTFPLISSGEIKVWGCVGSPASCSELTSNVCSCSSTSGITTCKLTGFTSTNYCGEEGNYYIKSSSTCIGSIYSTPQYIFTFSIDGDNDLYECECLGLNWIGTSCCGNDVFEYYNGAGSCDGTEACCTSASQFVKDNDCVNICAEIMEASWVGFSGQPIFKTGVGATLNLLAETEYFEDKNVNFIIYNENNEAIDFINDVDQVDETKIVTWKIPRVGAYYFKVESSDGSTNILTSNTLFVEDDEFNLPPFANIFSPVSESIFMKDEFIIFSANGSYDQDDFIVSTIWDVDDDKTSEEWEFQESYSIKGVKKIKLKVIGGEASEGREREAWDFADILICDGPGIYVFTNISYPFDGELINQNSIEFQSEGSYAMNCSDEVCGDCVDVDIDFFKWTLFKDTINSPEITSSEFRWKITNLVNLGEYIIRLTVGKDDVFDTREKEFKVYYDYSYSTLECVEPDRVIWRNLTDNSLVSSLNNCEQENLGTCCPEDYECVNDICVANDYLDYFSCLDYTVEEQCNNFNLVVAETSISNIREDGKTCPEVIDFIDGCLYSLENCRCEWDSENALCISGVDIVSSACDKSAPAEIGTCYYTENTDDDCDDGFLTYAWESFWQWSVLNPSQEDPLNEESNCVDGSNSIACPSQIQLPFFTVGTLLATIIVLGVIYWAWGLKKKKTKKRKKLRS